MFNDFADQPTVFDGVLKLFRDGKLFKVFVLQYVDVQGGSTTGVDLDIGIDTLLRQVYATLVRLVDTDHGDGSDDLQAELEGLDEVLIPEINESTTDTGFGGFRHRDGVGLALDLDSDTAAIANEDRLLHFGLNHERLLRWDIGFGEVFDDRVLVPSTNSILAGFFFGSARFRLDDKLEGFLGGVGFLDTGGAACLNDGFLWVISDFSTFLRCRRECFHPCLSQRKQHSYHQLAQTAWKFASYRYQEIPAGGGGGGGGGAPPLGAPTPLALASTSLNGLPLPLFHDGPVVWNSFTYTFNASKMFKELAHPCNVSLALSPCIPS